MSTPQDDSSDQQPAEPPVSTSSQDMIDTEKKSAEPEVSTASTSMLDSSKFSHKDIAPSRRGEG